MGRTRRTGRIAAKGYHVKHFGHALWKAAQTRLQPVATTCSDIDRSDRPAARKVPGAKSQSLKPALVRSFATSGYPFLTFYEFNHLTGWCRDHWFVPKCVPGYDDDIGRIYNVWTHETRCIYRRHIMLEELVGDISVTFEIPNLEAMSWFPLRIRVLDRDGLYFQTDQKLVVERIQDGKVALTSWRKIPQLRETLPRLLAMAQ